MCINKNKFILKDSLQSIRSFLGINYIVTYVWSMSELRSNINIIRNKPGVYGIYNPYSKRLYIGNKND